MSRKKFTEPYQKIQANIPLSLLDKLDEYAARTYRTRTDVIIEAAMKLMFEDA